jgi:hypothetical protein
VRPVCKSRQSAVSDKGRGTDCTQILQEANDHDLLYAQPVGCEREDEVHHPGAGGGEEAVELQREGEERGDNTGDADVCIKNEKKWI